MTKTTRPLERIYLTVISTDTEDDGTIFTFLAIDDFSKYLFLLGVDKTFTEQIIFDNITKLMNHKDFGHRLTDKFTLVMPFGEHIEKQINSIINSYKGSLIFDAKLVNRKIQPVLKMM